MAEAATCSQCRTRPATCVVRLAFADDCHPLGPWCEGCALPRCGECAREVYDLGLGEIRPVPDGPLPGEEG